MNDLISRQAVLNEFPHANWGKEWDEALARAIIESVPTIDPVKHGKWIKDGDTYSLYKCSVCNDFCTVAGYADCIPEERMYKVFKYCPNCGAHMERSEE